MIKSDIIDTKILYYNFQIFLNNLNVQNNWNTQSILNNNENYSNANYNSSYTASA